MTHLTLTASNGSRWSVQVTTRGFYGRPVPPGRECWAIRIEGDAPPTLRGILGFYASNVAEVRAKLA